MSGFFGVVAGVLVLGLIIWLAMRRMPFIGGKLKSYERDVKDKIIPGEDKPKVVNDETMVLRHGRFVKKSDLDKPKGGTK